MSAVAVVRLVKIAAGLVLLGVLLVSAWDGAATSSGGPTRATAAFRPAVDGVDPVSRCASPQTSADAGAVGTMAVVRTPAGEIRVVSFERGWAVYNGRAPGTFLAICRL